MKVRHVGQLGTKMDPVTPERIFLKIHSPNPQVCLVIFGGCSLKDSHLKNLGVNFYNSPSNSLQDILIEGDALTRVTKCDRAVVYPLVVSYCGTQMSKVLVDAS